MYCMDLHSLFNFNEVHSYEDNRARLNKENFIGTINVTNNAGVVSRAGDILFGFKNVNPYDVKITIYYLYELCVYEEVIIKSNQSAFLHKPILLISLFFSKPFTYKIECVESSETRLFDNHELQFMYGYTTSSVRNDLALHSYYYIENNQTYIYCRGCMYDSAWDAAIFSPYALNRDFAYKVYSGDYNYNSNRILDDFKEHNTHFVKLKCTNPFSYNSICV